MLVTATRPRRCESAAPAAVPVQINDCRWNYLLDILAQFLRNRYMRIQKSLRTYSYNSVPMGIKIATGIESDCSRLSELDEIR